MTYKQAYDKIIDAYFRDEIKPYHRNFCFCGTLAGSDEWFYNEDYGRSDFHRMEDALLITICDEMKPHIPHMNKFAEGEIENVYTDELRKSLFAHPNYEAAIFDGMSAALDVLKQIHIERGEVIDETPVFTKRNLQP